MRLPDFLKRFKNVEEYKPGKYMAHCPAHDDKHPSLSIAQAEDRILIHCFANCPPDAILKALGLQQSDLYFNNGKGKVASIPEPERQVKNGDHGLGDPVKVYDYQGADWKLLFQVCRYEPKTFRQRRPDGLGGWIYNLQGIEPVLYRLPLLLEAVKAGKPIFLAEGEKDSDNIAELGLDSTTAPMGAGKWKPKYSDSLAGAAVVILPDNDPPGRDHATKVAKALYGKAKSIKIVHLPDLPDKGDVSDWLARGGTREALEKLVSEAPNYEPSDAKDSLTQETINSFHQTDSGNAELFATLFGHQVRFDHKRKRWLIWRGHYWAEDTTGEIYLLAREAARCRYHAVHGHTVLSERVGLARFALNTENKKNLDALIALASNQPPISDPGTAWDSNPWLLAVRNGVIDLKTGQMIHGLQEQRITQVIDLDYLPEASEPESVFYPQRWIRFLGEIFNHDHELSDYIHRCIGYSLTGSIQEQCLFILYGKGANGKSLLLTTLRFVLGPYACDTSFSTFELVNRSNIPADLAALAGARFITASETGEHTRLNEARLKALTGGDPITARRLYSDFFSYEPTFKIWLAANHKPRAQDDSPGFWRRIRLIPFLKTFDPSAEPDISETLRSEAKGILAWAVQGVLEWQKVGLKPPKIVQEATKEYELESDPLADWFSEAVDTTDEAETKFSDLYINYKSWAERSGLRERDWLSQRSFGSLLSGKFKKDHKMKGTYYRGLRLKEMKDEGFEGIS